MYSGTTLTRFSGRLLGAHQKIDRVARHHLSKLLPDDTVFPSSRKILQFEGKNGPDAIKRKSPAIDEPWHYYDPSDAADTQLIDLIMSHYNQLVRELKAHNKERVAFEAAWLAHALVDGLTPAHHYPYEEKLVELRGGEGLETRTSIKEKWVMPGKTRRQQLKNNWKMWGPKGLIITHGLFEIGVATLILPLNFAEAVPQDSDLEAIQKLGLAGWFKQTAQEIDRLGLYELFYKSGWTPRLAYQVRQQLAPRIVRTVTLAWYLALLEAKQLKPTSSAQN